MVCFCSLGICSAKLGKDWMINSSELAEKTRKDPSASNVVELGGKLVGVDHYNSGSSEEQQAVGKIVSTLLSIPGHAQYFADEIEREQKEVATLPTNTGPRVSYDRRRAWHFETLRHLPSPETIKVLGHFLDDDKDTPVPLVSPDSDWGENPRANSWCAAAVIMEIGLRSAPVMNSRAGWDEKDATLAKTRAWWEEIKSGKRTFSFLGQKVEYRFKQDGTWETIALVNPPDDSPKPPAQPVSKIRANQDAAVPAHAVETLSRQIWLWIGAGVMVILGVVFWFRRAASA